jgi:hypothetical protein
VFDDPVTVTLVVVVAPPVVIELFPLVLKLVEFPPVFERLTTAVLTTVVFSCFTTFLHPSMTSTPFADSAPLSETSTVVSPPSQQQFSAELVFVPPATLTVVVVVEPPVVILLLPPVLKLEWFLPVFVAVPTKVFATVVLVCLTLDFASFMTAAPFQENAPLFDTVTLVAAKLAGAITPAIIAAVAAALTNLYFIDIN